MTKAGVSGPIVVDASVALAWMMPDEDAGSTREILNTVIEHGAYAPSIWPAEVANALLAAVRRQRITGPQRRTAIRALRDLPVNIDHISPEVAWTTLSDMAEDLGLTVYDAAYLEVALRRAMPLATLDKALKRAAVSAGARLVGGS